ncbi:hypothetical protein D5S17_23635 [Pseudonocardiaceae bacterium YIM PH 21723]|nr:hypothetical protein D5S17_23635 [Pseudonocardiaceae bacterium YIM PH 21723]
MRRPPGPLHHDTPTGHQPLQPGKKLQDRHPQQREQAPPTQGADLSNTSESTSDLGRISAGCGWFGGLWTTGCSCPTRTADRAAFDGDHGVGSVASGDMNLGILRTFSARLSVVATAIATFALTFAAPAPAPPVGSWIASEYVGFQPYEKCLGNAPGDYGNGVRIRLGNCSGGDWATPWTLVPVDQDRKIYRIRSSVSGPCLDARLEDIGSDGGAVQYWGCGADTQTNQQWQFDRIATGGSGTSIYGIYRLRNVYNGRCLDLRQEEIGTAHPGIQLWGCGAATQSNQLWRYGSFNGVIP